MGGNGRAGAVRVRGGRRTGRHTLLDNGSTAVACAVSATTLEVAVGGDAGVEVSVGEGLVAHPLVLRVGLDVLADRVPELRAARREVSDALIGRERTRNTGAERLTAVLGVVFADVGVAPDRLHTT